MLRMLHPGGPYQDHSVPSRNRSCRSWNMEHRFRRRGGGGPRYRSCSRGSDSDQPGDPTPPRRHASNSPLAHFTWRRTGHVSLLLLRRLLFLLLLHLQLLVLRRPSSPYGSGSGVWDLGLDLPLFDFFGPLPRPSSTFLVQPSSQKSVTWSR